MSLLKNKIAVVTGGSSGIGLATAKRFVEEGAYVFIAGRRQAELEKAIEEIGENVTGVKTDISKLDDLDRLYETVAKKGKIDVIFASAAFVEKTMTAGTPLARLARPEEIASAALFLASDQSSYVAGIDLPVDRRSDGCLDAQPNPDRRP